MGLPDASVFQQAAHLRENPSGDKDLWSFADEDAQDPGSGGLFVAGRNGVGVRRVHGRAAARLRLPRDPHPGGVGRADLWVSALVAVVDAAGEGRR